MILGKVSQYFMSLAHSRCLVNIHWANTGTKAWYPNKCFPKGDWAVSWLHCIGCRSVRDLSHQEASEGGTERGSVWPHTWWLLSQVFRQSHVPTGEALLSSSWVCALQRRSRHVRCSPEEVTAITPHIPSYLESASRGWRVHDGLCLHGTHITLTNVVSFFLCMCARCFFSVPICQVLHWVFTKSSHFLFTVRTGGGSVQSPISPMFLLP